ncbi:MAG: hypothetical protein H0T79_16845 [Deltaproteobacteria bacterium]|nr:hypothetical protein [Deltaproteobacteria bacterium]
MSDPPILKITSPKRALVQGEAGQITVTGTVAPNAVTGETVEKVMINNVQATLNADGSFSADVTIGEGATQIHTVARDAAGGEATDTRAVLAGELRAPGSNIDKAITAAISAEAFGKIAGAAGTIIKGLDINAMIQPMNPVHHAGDADGEDCLFDRVYVDDFSLTDAKITLVPAQGALNFSVEISGLDVPGHARFAVSCANGEKNWRVTADKILVSAELNITAKGMDGFDTKLLNPNVQFTNLKIQADGIPSSITNALRGAIETVVEKAAEMAMNPVMNKALGGLSGPQTIDILGKSLTMQVEPSAIEFDPAGGLVTLDTSMLIEGSEGSQGFVYTPNGVPNMNPNGGFQLGLADDLLNEMMSQFNAIGMLNLAQPTEGGSFDSTAMSMALPPVVSADPVDGKLSVIIGDMTATFTNHGTPVGKAAVNVKLDFQVLPAANGYGVAIKLGQPEINVDVIDDITNQTRFSNKDLARAVEVSLANQLEAISKLLTSIPLPQIAGLQMKDLSVGSDAGYVMVNGKFE